MMRRSMYVLMICAAAASFAQAAGQTPAPQATPAEAPAQVAPAAQATPATQATPTTPAAAQEAAPAAQAEVAVPAAPVQPGMEPLVKKDTLIGKGATAGPGSTVFVHYTGWLFKPLAPKQRGKEFDSSIKRGEPLSFVLGSGRVIKGWDQGILGMKVGGKRTLIIPSHLAYGSRGAGTMIAPGADLIFDVELVDVK